MGDLGRYDALVVMTGKQLWSHLDALAQWGDELKHLAILAAAGDDEPGGPVDRLRGFALARFPHLTITVTEPIYDDRPDAVFSAISELAKNLGGNIVVNASGGTRLMFLGASKASQLVPAVHTIFRDDDGPWYRLTPDGAAEQIGFLDADATDRFEVIDLLAVTWADESRRVVHRPTEPPAYLLEAAEACVAGKHYARAFNDAQDCTHRPRRRGDTIRGW